MKKKTKITSKTMVYLIENEEGELRYTLIEPDYYREKLHKKMTLGLFAFFIEDEPNKRSWNAMRSVLKDIIKLTK